MENQNEVKCHLCGGKAVLQFEELKLDEGKITIKDSPYYRCQKCKEEFSTAEQMKELDEQLQFRFRFQRSIIHAGRSLAITLPTDLVEFYNLKKGEKLTLIPDGKKQLRIKIQN